MQSEANRKIDDQFTAKEFVALKIEQDMKKTEEIELSDDLQYKDDIDDFDDEEYVEDLKDKE